MAKGLKTGGRTKGTPNKITAAFKDAVRTVYEDIGGNAAFAEWARQNPTDFYRIAARLIPTEVNATGAGGLTVIVDRSCGGEVAIDGECAPAIPCQPVGFASAVVADVADVALSLGTLPRWGRTHFPP